MNVRLNESNQKKLRLIERIISIENNEVIETLWTLLDTPKKKKAGKRIYLDRLERYRDRKSVV